MTVEGHDFVEWKEQFVSQERGSRVVHYYLEDSSGRSFLAVIGTERSVRHMFYVMAEDFAKLMGLEQEGSGSGSGSGSCLLKWRSRREVVDWLTSLLPRQSFQQQDYSKSPMNDSVKLSPNNRFSNGVNDNGSTQYRHMKHFSCNLKNFNSDIVWSGVFWTCGKQLKHYQAFCRSGITIPSHSFVLVMSEDEENCYLAYLEDMYEDKKGQKKVKVRWFHRHQEVAGAIPPPKPHHREAFITPYSQVISAECVDDRATVLTPEHYEKCLAVLQHSCPSEVYLCYRQYSKNKFKSFDLTSLMGYFDQSILSCLDICTVSGEDDEEFSQDANGKNGFRRIRSVRGRQRIVVNNIGLRMSPRCSQELSYQRDYQNWKFGLPAKRPLAVKFIGPRPGPFPPFRVDEKIELLCQDSGIRGCWFRCTILQISQKRLKVLYEDVQNEDDGGNLEEWVPAFRLAAPDKLGMRCSGRLTVRPLLLSDNSELPVLGVGNTVDVWWNDGWWEGVVIGVDNSADCELQVYFPGEDLTLNCQRKDVRISKDWVGNKWIDIEAKPDVLSIISAVSPSTKLSTSSMSIKGSDSSGSPTSERKDAVELKTVVSEEEMKAAHTLSGLLFENVKQDIRKKRRREGEEQNISGILKEAEKVDSVLTPVEG